MIQTVHFAEVEAKKLNKELSSSSDDVAFIVASVMEQDDTGHLRVMILILMIATTVRLSSWSWLVSYSDDPGTGASALQAFQGCHTTTTCAKQPISLWQRTCWTSVTSLFDDFCCLFSFKVQLCTVRPCDKQYFERQHVTTSLWNCGVIGNPCTTLPMQCCFWEVMICCR